MGQFPGVALKVPVKPEMCFSESWHSHQERIKECFMNNAEQTHVNGNKISKMRWHGFACHTCEVMPSHEVAPASASCRRIFWCSFTRHRAISNNMGSSKLSGELLCQNKRTKGTEVSLQSFLSTFQRSSLKKHYLLWKLNEGQGNCSATCCFFSQPSFGLRAPSDGKQFSITPKHGFVWFDLFTMETAEGQTVCTGWER